MTDIRKINQFAPELNANLMLANTSNHKLYIFGLKKSIEESKDQSSEFFQQEIISESKVEMSAMCETKKYLIIATTDKRILFVNSQLQITNFF